MDAQARIAQLEGRVRYLEMELRLERERHERLLCGEATAREEQHKDERRLEAFKRRQARKRSMGGAR